MSLSLGRHKPSCVGFVVFALLWGAASLAAFFLHQTQSTMHHHHPCTLLFARANAAFPVILQRPLCSSSLSFLSPPPPPPAYYGWLLCVGRMGLDIIDIVIASRIIIVIIVVSPPFPAEGRRAGTCKGVRGHGGNCFSINTAPLPW